MVISVHFIFKNYYYYPFPYILIHISFSNDRTTTSTNQQVGPNLGSNSTLICLDTVTTLVSKATTDLGLNTSLTSQNHDL